MFNLDEVARIFNDYIGLEEGSIEWWDLKAKVLARWYVHHAYPSEITQERKAKLVADTLDRIWYTPLKQNVTEMMERYYVNLH